MKHVSHYAFLNLAGFLLAISGDSERQEPRFPGETGIIRPISASNRVRGPLLRFFGIFRELSGELRRLCDWGPGLTARSTRQQGPQSFRIFGGGTMMSFRSSITCESKGTGRRADQSVNTLPAYPLRL